MGEFDRIQQQIYSIVMDGAAAPKPEEDDEATILLWYEAQICQDHRFLRGHPSLSRDGAFT